MKTFSALASSFGLFLGLYIAALATMAGSPLAALAAGLMGIAALASLVFAPEVSITESIELPQVDALPTRGIVAPMACGTLLASGLYGAVVLAAAALPLLSLAAGALAIGALSSLALGSL